MATVEQAFTRVKRIFPEADQTSILDYLNEVHNELVTTLPIVVDTEDLTLVVSQQEYTLDADIVRVWSAYLHKSTTDIRPLTAKDVSEMNIREPLWRRKNASDPTGFYVWRNTTEQVVGLDPKPISATSGTYPFVRLHVTRTATLTRSSDLPKAIMSTDVYVFGACARYANEPNSMMFYRMRYEQLLEAEIAKFHGINVQSKPSIIPGFIPRGGIA